MKWIQTFEGFLTEATAQHNPSKFVKGKLKNFIFIYDEKAQEIGCKFTRTFEEEIDIIEDDDSHGEIFNSVQISDKGVRPIEMKYTPVKGVAWTSFVKELEEVFDAVFE